MTIGTWNASAIRRERLVWRMCNEELESRIWNCPDHGPQRGHGPPSEYGSSQWSGPNFLNLHPRWGTWKFQIWICRDGKMQSAVGDGRRECLFLGWTYTIHCLTRCPNIHCSFFSTAAACFFFDSLSARDLASCRLTHSCPPWKTTIKSQRRSTKIFMYTHLKSKNQSKASNDNNITCG